MKMEMDFWYIECDDTNPDIGLDCDEDGFLPEEDCDDSDPLLGGDFEDCDGDGISIDEDCDDGDYSIGFGERTGHLEDCAGTDCLSILENGYSLGDGVYWISPYDEEPFEVYCDMTTEGGGWILSDLTQISGAFGSLPVYAGSFDSGEPGVAPYSLDLDKLHRGDGDTFDIMTWTGEEDIHKLTFLNYTKSSTSFHVLGNGPSTHLGIRPSGGFYFTDYKDGYFSSTRTFHFYDPPCGFYVTTSWSNCPYGDNQRDNVLIFDMYLTVIWTDMASIKIVMTTTPMFSLTVISMV